MLPLWPNGKPAATAILWRAACQYLCLVAKQGAAGLGKIYLPFEGDTMLSVILSKAFMLANDSKIMDETIMSQIKPATEG